MIRPAVSASWLIIKARILSSQRDWETEALSLLMVAFQRNVFQVLEKKKHFLLIEDTYTLQRDRSVPVQHINAGRP